MPHRSCATAFSSVLLRMYPRTKSLLKFRWLFGCFLGLLYLCIVESEIVLASIVWYTVASAMEDVTNLMGNFLWLTMFWWIIYNVTPDSRLLLWQIGRNSSQWPGVSDVARLSCLRSLPYSLWRPWWCAIAGMLCLLMRRARPNCWSLNAKLTPHGSRHLLSRTRARRKASARASPGAASGPSKPSHIFVMTMLFRGFVWIGDDFTSTFLTNTRKNPYLCRYKT